MELLVQLVGNNLGVNVLVISNQPIVSSDYYLNCSPEFDEHY